MWFRRAPSSDERWPSAAQDRLAVALLTLIPLAGFGIPALLNRAVLSGVNLYQNLPLRLAAGQALREGHLPLWNPGLWSGTALLGGFNAGAAYPGTLLFAILPPLPAWTLNLIAVFAVGGLGMYALLREHGLTPLAAGLGAFAGTFAGFMPAQLERIGLVQGLSWTPWIFFALERLGSSREHRWACWLLLCAAGGMVLLTGEPRAVTSGALLTTLYLAGRLPHVQLGAQLLIGAVAAAPVSFALGAFQILPGLRFVAASQRGQVGYGYFAQGPSWEILPRLLNPHFAWAHHYLDTEVWGYVGLLPLVAALTYPFWRRQARGAPGTWLLIALVGLTLSLASLTPLGPLLHQLPLYGGQRMQARNVALLDLGLAGLFACWVDAWLAKPEEALTRTRQRLQLMLSLLPCAAMGVLAPLAFAFEPDRLRPLLGVPRGAILIPLTLAIAASYALLLLTQNRPAPMRAAALAALVSLDLGLAGAHLNWSSLSLEALGRASSPSDAIAGELGSYGRLGTDDPDLSVRDALGLQLTPDVSLWLKLRSVQGHGSTVDAEYSAATGSHDWGRFSAQALAGEIADELNLRLFLLPSSSFPTDGQPVRDPRILASLAAPHWVEGERLDAYRTFVNTRAKGRAWFEPLAQSAEASVSATDRVNVSRVDGQDGEIDLVSTSSPALLVRSVAYGEGWTATLRDARGEGWTVPALRHHLVQAVEVPGGEVTVTWAYEPPGAKLGLALSLSAAIGLASLGLALLIGQLFSRFTA